MTHLDPIERQYAHDERVAIIEEGHKVDYEMAVDLANRQEWEAYNKALVAKKQERLNG